MSRPEGQDKQTGDKKGTATEYFCTVCLQLRLSLRVTDLYCGNCGSTRIINGEVGSLDKQALLTQHRSSLNTQRVRERHPVNLIHFSKGRT